MTTSRITQSGLYFDELSVIVEKYIVANQLCPRHRDRLRIHVRKFQKWHHDRPSVPEGESDSDRLNGWLASLADSYAPASVNGYRQSIITLIRFATPDGMPLIRGDRVRRQREPDKINPAFRLDEIRKMVVLGPKYFPMTNRTFGRGIAGDVIPRHRPDGLPWSLWWTAFVLISYHSGQYLAELCRIRWDDIGEGGSVSIVRHKTGRMLSFRLPERAIKAADLIRAHLSSDLVLPWSYDTQSYFSREFRKFRFARVRCLGPKSLRRSAITYAYIQQGEEAARQLAGHANFATTAKHYIDWSIARRPIIQPPDLELDRGTERGIRRAEAACPSHRQAKLIRLIHRVGGVVTPTQLAMRCRLFRPNAVARDELDKLVEKGWGDRWVAAPNGRRRLEFALKPDALDRLRREEINPS